MPIYEYVCQNCKATFEVIRPMSQADSPIACTTCGENRVKRMLSMFYAESGGKAVAGSATASCAACSSSDCSACRH